MLVAKSSLVSLLLEDGEEDLAVLIARSELPERLSVERDSERLAALGLAEEDLQALLPTITGDASETPGLDGEAMAGLEQTISDRWADLVDDWTGTERG